jgi:hypothetical protein
MIVFGGSDGHASFADVHVLNLSEWSSSVFGSHKERERREG